MQKQHWDIRHHPVPRDREKRDVTQTSASHGLPRPSVTGQNAPEDTLQARPRPPPWRRRGSKGPGCSEQCQISARHRALQMWVCVPAGAADGASSASGPSSPSGPLGPGAAVASCAVRKLSLVLARDHKLSPSLLVWAWVLPSKQGF